MTDVRVIKLCVLGFGNVVQRFCEIVSEREASLEREYGVRFVVSAVTTKRHGSLLEPAGIRPGELLTRFRRSGFPASTTTAAEMIAQSEADVLVESTTLTSDGQPAIHHVDAAFDARLDVVLVNKGPVAWDYRRLKDRARSEGRQFRHEGVTMDGCPVYNLAEFCLPGDRIIGFRGVLNSTSNYVLDAMAEGANMEEASLEATAAGFAEADPSLDLDGHDAAAKVAALCNVLLEADLTPDDVPRQSVRELSLDDVAKVIAYGRRLRMIGEGKRSPEGEVSAKVSLEPVRSQDPMYWVSGTSSSLILETELAGTIEIVERDGLLTQTAYAVYADLLTIAKSG